MANIFDQFDEPEGRPAIGMGGGNIFDQFDEPSAPGKEQGWLEYANNLARAAANGVTFGHADELAGAVGSLAGQRSYSDIRNEQDQGIRDFRESNPVAAYGAEIGGG